MLYLNSKGKTDDGERNLRKTSGNREESSSDKRREIPCRCQNCYNRHENLGILPCVKTTSLRPDGQGDGNPKACPEQAAADSWGSRTCVCANTSGPWVAHAGGEGWIDVLLWNRLVGVAKTSSETHRRKSRAAQKRVSGSGKAGENGQNSGAMGGSSPWTGPSAPDCGDTIKALAGDQRPI